LFPGQSAWQFERDGSTCRAVARFLSSSAKEGK
jgi:hypothetical protein